MVQSGAILTRNIFILSCFFSFVSTSITAKSNPSSNDTYVQQGINVLNETSKAFTKVAKTAIPAVVYIKTQAHISPTTQQNPHPFNQEFFNRFFGNQQSYQEQNPSLQGSGTGFFINASGYIVTNSHVIKNAERITVTLQDGRELEAEVIGNDPSTEVALIKVEGEGFPYLELGNSDQLEVGEWVVAIGNPFEFRASLTAGIVSAKGRNNLNITKWEDFIQTDAAINPGNSGGPLLNLHSQAIGINTAIHNRSIGIGFAIPSNIVHHITEQLIDKGQVAHGFLGVLLQPLTSELAQAFCLEERYGAVVIGVSPNSPAEQAGLQQGDIILKYNETPMQSSTSFSSNIALMEPGTTLHLNVNREGEIIDLCVAIGQHPQEAIEKASGYIGNKLGLVVSDLTMEQAHQLGYQEDKGALVMQVTPNSMSANTGILPGSLILAVNRKKVSSSQEFYDTVKNTPSNQRILLLVKYGKITRFITIKVH